MPTLLAHYDGVYFGGGLVGVLLVIVLVLVILKIIGKL